MTPRAAYAAMISRMDQQIGDIMDLLKKLGIDENTLMIFSGDNGTTFNGGSDAEFFNSVGPLHGLKCSLYEGGITRSNDRQMDGQDQTGNNDRPYLCFLGYSANYCRDYKR